MKRTTKEELTNSVIDNIEENENGFTNKHLSLTNRQIFEISFCCDLLNRGGAKVSPSLIVRMCLDDSLERVKEKIFDFYGYDDFPSFNSR